jgi:hypothetical protein
MLLALKQKLDILVFGSTVDINFNTLSLGFGYRQAISINTDLFGIISYQNLEVYLEVFL